MVERLHIGMTGTREGMTSDQRDSVRGILKNLQNLYERITLHHGDCVGADADMHHLFREYRRSIDRIVIHPPIDTEHRAYCEDFHTMLLPKTHFARNRDIVDESSILIVTPLQSEHQKHGGTWYTHDYAQKKERRIYLILPDGTFK